MGLEFINYFFQYFNNMNLIINATYYLKSFFQKNFPFIKFEFEFTNLLNFYKIEDVIKVNYLCNKINKRLYKVSAYCDLPNYINYIK